MTLWEAQDPSTTYTRAGSVPFTIGESRAADIFGHQVQFADTLSWSRGRHNLRFGGSVIHHTTGGIGQRARHRRRSARSRSSARRPRRSSQLTLADVQQYSQPVSYGITSYELKQWMSVAFVQDSFRVNDQLTLDAGPSLRPADADRRDEELRAAARLRLASRTAMRALVDSRRLRDVLHADPRQRARQRADRRPRRHRHLHRDARADRLPDLPDRTVPAGAARSADAAARRSSRRATSRSAPGSADFYQHAVRDLRAELRPAAELPRRVREPAQPGDVDRRRARDHAAACSPAPTTCTSTGPTSIAASI